MGSSFAAIEAVAREEGYVIVDVEPGYDLFLARADAWGARPVLRGAELERRAYAPFNLPADRGTVWGARKMGAYLELPALQASGGSYAAARAGGGALWANAPRGAAARFENGARREREKGPSCSRAQKVHCPTSMRGSAPSTAPRARATPYPPSAAQLLQEGLATIGPPLRLASPGPLVAAVRK